MMLLLMSCILWLSFMLIFWTFIGYPLSVIIFSKLFPKQWRKETFMGRVSIIIAAYNEEDVISDKVKNCLKLYFGPADAEIIIVSDGSIDGTNSILDEYTHADQRLRIISYHPRAGKANALNVAVAQARGEVLIFSDANVMIEEHSCCSLLTPFADPSVGAVCGRVLVKARGTEEIAGESLYMRYEAAVQRAEALLGSMVGADGALFALRRELFSTLSPDTILDDFTLSMQAPARGLRIVYQPQARAVEEVVPSAANEFKRKARIVAGGYQFLADRWNNGQSYAPWMWCAFFSHKILRWLAPFLLIAILAINLFLLESMFYLMLFGGQTVFYTLAILGLLNKEWRRHYVIYLPYYFCAVNLAAFSGFFRFLRLRQGALWEKVAR